MVSTPLDGMDGLVCDLDGVVYAGPKAIPGAVESLNEISDRLPVLFATNNASRPPDVVAGHLHDLGITTTTDRVVTSSTAGARVLADLLPAGTQVLAVGGIGVARALEDVGLQPVGAVDCTTSLPTAVLQGYGPDVTATDLATASFAVAAGARWVATNRDLTLPTERGPAPGNGALVAAVAIATGVEPESVGKPGPLMYQQAADLVDAQPRRMLGVGDRLETDIAGARAAGMKSAMVLTGVHGPLDLAVALRDMRPDFILNDLTDLLTPYEPVCRAGECEFTCGPARSGWTGNRLEFSGGGIERVRVVLAALWQARDQEMLDADAAREVMRSSVGLDELR